MLVLGRRVNQTIVVDTTDGQIKFLIVRLSDDRVRIGVDAPKHVNICRGEIYDTKGGGAE